ncbi:MAG: hypothetical protein QNJ57_08350 [Flavobacteriaceae bacterium]|nr:hypothetical protein [Flavobacteriaceae bacterium]
MKNKKILIIAPLMFHYHQALIDELAKNNRVIYFPDQPKGAFTALKRKVSERFSRRYYEKLLLKVKNEKIDFFLLINGKGITREFIIGLRNSNQSAKFITYQWDSIARNNIERKTNYLYFLDLFDSCYSFDPKDAASIKRLKYLPTYHTVASQSTSEAKRPIDLLMVASYTKERYSFIKSNSKEFKRRNLTFYHHLFIPWHHYVRNSMLKGEFSNPKYLKFRAVTRERLNELYSKSKSTIDLQYEHQKGFTMRIMEGLAHHCKIITSNQEITKESFYDENNIKIFDISSFWKDFNAAFLSTNFRPNRYIVDLHVSEWIKKVLS